MGVAEIAAVVGGAARVRSPADSPPAITVRGLSKHFRMPEDRRSSVRELVLDHRRRPRRDSLAALCDVSFDLSPGACVAVVGRNGSGKSTLLRCLAGIYPPSTGSVMLSGRAAAFIELGVGFDRERSARENLLTGGMLFGLSASESRRRVPEILAYAELESFADVQLKNYSSGMAMRLGFALTTQIDADVLLFDEVIATGDLAFQRKCFARFHELRAEGRTLVFVSHDMGAVAELCDRGIVLERGRIIHDGDAAGAAECYEEVNLGARDDGRASASGRLRAADGAVVARLATTRREPRGWAQRPRWRQTARLALRFAAVEYRGKYAGALLGYLWAVLRPLGTFAGLYVVFTRVAHFNAGVHHYAAYLLSSLVLWTFFMDATSSAVHSLVAHADLLRKIPVAGVVMPLAVVLRALFDLGMNLIAVAVFIALAGIAPQLSWVELVPMILALTVVATAVSLLTSSLYVRLRDIGQLWATVVQLLFYASPILYVVSTVPRSLRPVVMALNPLAAIFTQMRHALIDPTAPTAAAAAGGAPRLLLPAAVTIVLLGLGASVFRRLAPLAPEHL